MFLCYTVTLDDIVAFSRQYMEGSPSYKRNRWNSVWGTPALYLVLGALLAFLSLWVFAFIIVILAVYFHFRYRYYYGRGLEKRLRAPYSQGKNVSTFGEHRIEIADDGLLFRTAVSETKMLWAGIEKVVVTSTHLFVFTSIVSACTISRNGILEGNFDEFVKTLQERYAAASSPKPAMQ